MKRALIISAVAAAATVLTAPGASATIHPIVESADCASATADAAHPLGDVAEPPGQTPGEGSHSDTSTLRALQGAADQAFFGHKLDGQCGKVGQ
jgi:hypothetical protein